MFQISLFDEFIKLNLSESSESIFGLKKQPSPTCPLLDNVLENLRRSCKEEELYTLERQIEEIRDRVKEIRSWGQEWKNLALNRRNYVTNTE